MKNHEELELHFTEKTEATYLDASELEIFTYTVSHDLKSPIRAIDGYSRIMLEDYGYKMGADEIEVMQNIRNICKDTIEMINKLLQYSIASNTEIVKDKIDIAEMLKTIFNELLAVNKDRDIKLILETVLPVVYADKVMLKQVINNILSNSIKFTKYKAKALITVGCTVTEREYIFCVKDNGMGFDMDFVGKLFNVFERLHTSDEIEGSGIGLVTIKKIIQRHGGRVWIEGELEVGAALYFTLPIE